MRRTWVQVNGRMYEKGTEPQPVRGPYVVGDIQPYKSMVTGEMIEGRAQHRAHLAQHGLIEVGNEVKALMNLRPERKPTDFKPAIAEALRKHGRL